MKRAIWIRMVWALVAGVVLGACGETTEVPERVIPEPTIALELGDKNYQSLSFILTTKNAAEVYWLCIDQRTESESGDEQQVLVPTAEEIFELGTEARNNRTDEVFVQNLYPETHYLIYAAARNGSHTTMAEPLAALTESEPQPTIALEAGEASDSTLHFTITTSQAKTVYWLAVQQSQESAAPSVEELESTGNRVTPNTTVEAVAAGLIPESEYRIYALVKSLTHMLEAEPLVMYTTATPEGEEESTESEEESTEDKS